MQEDSLVAFLQTQDLAGVGRRQPHLLLDPDMLTGRDKSRPDLPMQKIGHGNADGLNHRIVNKRSPILHKGVKSELSSSGRSPPRNIVGHRQGRPNLPSADCPFCVGGLEAPEPYDVRWFPNRWPALAPGAPIDLDDPGAVSVFRCVPRLGDAAGSRSTHSGGLYGAAPGVYGWVL